MQNSIFRIIQMVFILGLAAFVASCQSNSFSQDTQACKPATTARASFSVADLLGGPLQHKSVSHTMPSPRCGTNPDQIAEYVRRIFLDNYGNYWLGTNALGVFRYFNGESNYYSLEEGLGGTQVTGIIEDKKGRVWVANSGGVAVIDGIVIKNYGKESGLKNDRLWCVLEDSKGTIWVGGDDGVYTFNGTGFEPFPLPFCKSQSEIKKGNSLRVSALMEDSKGNIWIGTEGKGALRYNGEKFTTFNMEDGLADKHIVCILEDKKGNIWFSSRFHGLGFYDGNNFTNFSTATGLGNDEVWTIMEDKEGNIWFSSEGYGVYKYNGNSFENFGENEGLKVQAVQTIYQDRFGQIWAGGGGGLFKLEGKKFIEIKRKDDWYGC